MSVSSSLIARVDKYRRNRNVMAHLRSDQDLRYGANVPGDRGLKLAAGLGAYGAGTKNAYGGKLT